MSEQIPLLLNVVCCFLFEWLFQGIEYFWKSKYAFKGILAITELFIFTTIIILSCI